VLDPQTTTWRILITGALMILHCTVLWSPINRVSQLLLGESYDPPWTIWLRVFGVFLVLMGFAITGWYWWGN
jgi:hypothetical protein